MPELSEQMYCSEQICIPPTFPYLLRQYAKAAIRSQPSDLLRWSSAYFRCLSLNLTPPVKVRLEYPIPRDYQGITPGWLKALLNQYPNTQTISFKVLWDKWMGACLQHNTLIQLLCLGGFDNVEAIPWLRFLALCASQLTDDLTHTMILICEILTEEPEGGSAMITVEVFVDLYKFLAKLDASSDQYLKNYWFRDSLLDLWRERSQKLEAVEEQKEEATEREVSEASKASSVVIEVEAKMADSKEQISCPSLPEDDHYTLEYILQVRPEDQEQDEEEGEGEAVATEAEEAEDDFLKPEEPIEEAEMFVPRFASALGEDDADKEEKEPEDDAGTEMEELEGENGEEPPSPKLHEGGEEGQGKVEETTEGKAEVQPYESVETVTDEPVRDLTFDDDEERQLKEDLERLKALQQEMPGETDDELERFKCRLIAEMPLTKSQELAVDRFREPPDESSEEEKIDLMHGGKERKAKDDDASSESQEAEPTDYDEIFCKRIPGIGAIVSDELVNAVVEYMHNVAKVQHGMVMPRNIRHYNCPPLEIVSDE